MIIIPHDQLHPATLQTLIEEFVTRDGAIQGHVDTSMPDKTASVLAQLKSGAVFIVFDEENETCTIVPKEMVQQLETK